MEPIISSWVFYLLELYSNIQFIFIAGLVCSFITLVIILIAFTAYILDVPKSYQSHNLKKFVTIMEKKINDEDCTHIDTDAMAAYKCLRIGRAVRWVVFACSAWLLFTPSNTTIIKMYATQYVTMNNIEKAMDKAEDFKKVLKGDLIDLIQSAAKAHNEAK